MDDPLPSLPASRVPSRDPYDNNTLQRFISRAVSSSSGNGFHGMASRPRPAPMLSARPGDAHRPSVTATTSRVRGARIAPTPQNTPAAPALRRSRSHDSPGDAVPPLSSLSSGWLSSSEHSSSTSSNNMNTRYLADDDEDLEQSAAERAREEQILNTVRMARGVGLSPQPSATQRSLSSRPSSSMAARMSPPPPTIPEEPHDVASTTDSERTHGSLHDSTLPIPSSVSLAAVRVHDGQGGRVTVSLWPGMEPKQFVLQVQQHFQRPIVAFVWRNDIVCPARYICTHWKLFDDGDLTIVTPDTNATSMLLSPRASSPLIEVTPVPPPTARSQPMATPRMSPDNMDLWPPPPSVPVDSDSGSLHSTPPDTPHYPSALSSARVPSVGSSDLSLSPLAQNSNTPSFDYQKQPPDSARLPPPPPPPSRQTSYSGGDVFFSQVAAALPKQQAVFMSPRRTLTSPMSSGRRAPPPSARSSFRDLGNWVEVDATDGYIINDLTDTPGGTLLPPPSVPSASSSAPPSRSLSRTGQRRSTNTSEPTSDSIPPDAKGSIMMLPLSRRSSASFRDSGQSSRKASITRTPPTTPAVGPSTNSLFSSLRSSTSTMASSTSSGFDWRSAKAAPVSPHSPSSPPPLPDSSRATRRALAAISTSRSTVGDEEEYGPSSARQRKRRSRRGAPYDASRRAGSARRLPLMSPRVPAPTPAPTPSVSANGVQPRFSSFDLDEQPNTSFADLPSPPPAVGGYENSAEDSDDESSSDSQELSGSEDDATAQRPAAAARREIPVRRSWSEPNVRMNSGLLHFLRLSTGMAQMNMIELTSHFKRFADSRQRIDFPNFSEAVLALPGVQLADSDTLTSIVNNMAQLFEYVDTGSTGYVDHQELVSAASVFCRGAKNDKLRFMFEMFDSDGNGLLDRDDLARYLRALYRGFVFAVGNTMDTTVLRQHEDRVVRDAVRQCFESSDYTGNQRLNYYEFEAWHMAHPEYMQWLRVLSAQDEDDSSEPDDDDEAKELPGDDDAGDEEELAFVFHDVDLDIAFTSPALKKLLTLRKVTGFSELSALEVVEHFIKHARMTESSASRGVHDHTVPAGREQRDRRRRRRAPAMPVPSMDRGVFEDCMLSLPHVRQMTTAQQAALLSHVSVLFEWFDRDGNGVVDLSEFTTGLAMLCGGDKNSKLRTLFEVMDENGDGLLSLAEMEAFLDSLYLGIILLVGDEEDAEQYNRGGKASGYALNCFRSCGLSTDDPHQGLLSFGAFRSWINSQPPSLLHLLDLTTLPSREFDEDDDDDDDDEEEEDNEEEEENDNDDDDKEDEVDNGDAGASEAADLIVDLMRSGQDALPPRPPSPPQHQLMSTPLRGSGGQASRGWQPDTPADHATQRMVIHHSDTPGDYNNNSVLYDDSFSFEHKQGVEDENAATRLLGASTNTSTHPNNTNTTSNTAPSASTTWYTPQPAASSREREASSSYYSAPVRRRRGSVDDDSANSRRTQPYSLAYTSSALRRRRRDSGGRDEPFRRSGADDNKEEDELGGVDALSTQSGLDHKHADDDVPPYSATRGSHTTPARRPRHHTESAMLQSPLGTTGGGSGAGHGGTPPQGSFPPPRVPGVGDDDAPASMPSRSTHDAPATPGRASSNGTAFTPVRPTPNERRRAHRNLNTHFQGYVASTPSDRQRNSSNDNNSAVPATAWDEEDAARPSHRSTGGQSTPYRRGRANVAGDRVVRQASAPSGTDDLSPFSFAQQTHQQHSDAPLPSAPSLPNDMQAQQAVGGSSMWDTPTHQRHGSTQPQHSGSPLVAVGRAIHVPSSSSTTSTTPAPASSGSRSMAQSEPRSRYGRGCHAPRGGNATSLTPGTSGSQRAHHLLQELTSGLSPGLGSVDERKVPPSLDRMTSSESRPSAPDDTAAGTSGVVAGRSKHFTYQDGRTQFVITHEDLLHLAELRRRTALGGFDLAKLHEHFQQFSSRGHINRKLFLQAVFALKSEPADDGSSSGQSHSALPADMAGALSALFHRILAPKQTSLAVNELVVALAAFSSGDMSRKLAVAFRLYDADLDSYVSRAELYNLVRVLYRGVRTVSSDANRATDRTPTEANMAEHEAALELVRLCFQQSDRSRNDAITFQEFSLWLIRELSQHRKLQDPTSTVSWITLLDLNSPAANVSLSQE